MSDSDQQKPGPQRTLSIGKNEINDRDPTLRIIPDSGPPRTVLLVLKILDIGSEARQDISLQYPGVAPRHARLTLEGGSYRLFDLTGRQGVLLNKKPIDTEILHDGDMIRLQDAQGQGVTLTYFNPVERAFGTQSVDKTYDLVFPFTIGRDPASSLKLDALAVSWHHAEITDQGGRHTLTDLKSTNGIFVNDRRISGPYRLQPEDVIRIDTVLLVYKGKALLRLPSVQRFQLDAVDLDMTYHTGIPRHASNTMRDVTLSIHPQEFVAIIGGSGSGKSTLLRALNGANRATGGHVLINGDDLYSDYALYQPIIGYVPQADIVQNDLTVHQALSFGSRLRFPNEPKEAREQRIQRVLETLELTDFSTQLVRSLSGGQKKRVSIALELMAEPSLLFMDEPSSGLDPGLDKSMMDTLRRLADRGHIVAVVTHTTLNIGQCDKLLLMARGNLAYYGPPKEALSFFGVRDYPEIYNRVYQPVEEDSTEKPSQPVAAAKWADHFRESALYVKEVTSRLMKPTDKKPVENSTLSNKQMRGSRRGSFLQQLRVLTERTLTLAVHDSRTMIALLLVLPLVGIFLASINTDKVAGGRGKMLISRGSTADYMAVLEKIPLTPVTNGGPGGVPTGLSGVQAQGVFTPATDAQRLLFTMALSVTLLGIFASAYTIVEERSLFLRERMVNLRIPAYLLSKLVVFGGLALVSCVLLLIVLSFGVQFPEQGLITWGPLELFITVALTALAGVSLGLLISALVRQVNAVTYVVLAVLFIQILFPGFLFRMDGALEPLAKITITRWSLEALGGTANIMARNSEGQFIVLAPVVGKDGKPLTALDPTRRFLPAPNVLNLTYPQTAGELVTRWGVLTGFTILFLVVARFALNREESF